MTLPVAVFMHSAPNATAQIDAAALNRSELKALEDIVSAGLSRHANLPDRDVEVTHIEVKRITKNAVFVVVEVGYVGDASSALSLIRTRGTFLVGSRGAIKVCHAAGDTRKKGNPLIVGWER